uniref:Uncharacterized protein n=1 Tax=Rhizophora mucronata TaxID=61149 RepID=A0A2P2JJT1_RHIMU
MLILIAITEMVYEWQLHVITSFLSQILQSFLWQVQGHLQRQKMMLEEILPQLPQNALVTFHWKRSSPFSLYLAATPCQQLMLHRQWKHSLQIQILHPSHCRKILI